MRKLIDIVYEYRALAIILAFLLAALIYLDGRISHLETLTKENQELILWRNRLPCQ